MFSFMFATGIENSCPTIQGGRVRVDEMAKCGFYEHWKTDFDLVEELGIRFLRFGPSILHTWLGPDRYDWELSDLHFNELRKRDILPIVDLCHFGVPDWLGNFQNPDFPAVFECRFEFAIMDVELPDLPGHVRACQQHQRREQPARMGGIA